MLQRFLDYMRYELNRTPLTVKAYSTDITQFQEWLSPGNPDEVDYPSVTSSDIRAWLAHRAKKGDTPRTLRRKVISLRSLYRWMVKTGLIKVSPVSDIALPKISKPLPDIIKPTDIEEALKNMATENDDKEETGLLHILVIETLYSLGIRRAELASINDSDISLSKGEIKITGKRSKQRLIPVPQRLLKLFEEWQQVRDRTQEFEEEDRPLFSINGKRLSHHQIYYIVKKSLSETSARKKSPHALRHSFASGMLNGGAEIDSVREFLGHASLATTQIYTHISFKDIQKAYSVAHPRSSAGKKENPENS